MLPAGAAAGRGRRRGRRRRARPGSAAAVVVDDAQVSSESWVHERRLRLSEPTEAQTSSRRRPWRARRPACRRVLEAVDGDPVAAGGRSVAARVPGRASCGMPASAPSWSGKRGTTAISCRSGLAAQRLGEELGRPRPTTGTGPRGRSAGGPGHRLAVAAGDAALAPRGERIAAAPVRVRPQQLDRVRAARRRVGQLRRQRVGARVLASQPRRAAGERVAGQRGRVVPALPERSSRRRRPPGRGWRAGRRATAAVARTPAPSACGCGSPACSASSRRLWHRSMPPTNATSRSGRPGWRSTTNFWWCEPPTPDPHVQQALAAGRLDLLAEAPVLRAR